MTRKSKFNGDYDRAADTIREALRKSPLRTGDIIELLGHSCVDFALTKIIGDGAGRFDRSPEQMALTELVDSREIVWWRDEHLDVWYGLPSCRAGKMTGNDAEEYRAIESQLDWIANFIGEPRYDSDGNGNEIGAGFYWSQPCIGVREIDLCDADGQAIASVSMIYDGHVLRIDDADYLCGGGCTREYYSGKLDDEILTIADSVRSGIEDQEKRDD